jgi:metallo-beta-lactamase family protein
VFLESTYGDKDHPSLAGTAVAAREAVKAAVEQGGRVLVPVFAVGRSQLLLYLLAGAFKRGTLKPFPIFLDSPMAIRATDVYKSHAELFDAEAIGMRRSGDLSANLRTARICQKAADSYALARKPGPWMVLAGAGMCTGGRIMHHLQNHLPDPTTLVLMVGYQSRGSVGRALADGAKEVRRPCRAIGPPELVRNARLVSAAGDSHARRRRATSGPGQMHSGTVRPPR